MFPFWGERGDRMNEEIELSMEYGDDCMAMIRESKPVLEFWS